MGAIGHAASAANVDLSVAALQADMLADSTNALALLGGDGIERAGLFVASNGVLAFSAPFDLDRDSIEIEKLIGVTNLALPKNWLEVRKSPEKHLCIMLGGLLRKHGWRGTTYRKRMEHAVTLKLIACVLAGTTGEHRLHMWREAAALATADQMPALAFLVSNPAVHNSWFRLKPSPHFEAVVPVRRYFTNSSF